MLAYGDLVTAPFAGRGLRTTRRTAAVLGVQDGRLATILGEDGIVYGPIRVPALRPVLHIGAAQAEEWRNRLQEHENMIHRAIDVEANEEEGVEARHAHHEEEEEEGAVEEQVSS